MAEHYEEQDWHDRLTQTQEKLEKVSPTFCAAKWLQVTVHLQNGMTHSCHHPEPHHIPLSEVAANPDALHNTVFKQQQRQLMREGQRPKECDFCWRAEDASRDTFSDRTIKSSDAWADTDFVNLAKLDRPVPTYLEVSFGNACNLKCMYCSPEVSSAIWSEHEKYGPYPVEGSLPLSWYEDNNRRPYKASEVNPYLEAFKEWFPQILPQLKVFRITGGEPLLNPQTFKTIELLRESHVPDLYFSINTNLMVPTATVESLALSMEELAATKKLKDVRLYTSVDAHGSQANWIRHGLDYKVLFKHAHRFLKLAPHVSLTFTATHNIFSFASFNLMLADILELKRAHIREIRPDPRVMVDPTWVRFPSYLSSIMAPEELRRQARHSWEFMQNNAETPAMPWGFNSYERNKMLRLCEILETGPTDLSAEEVQNNLKQLKRFVLEYDRRKGGNYLRTFPEHYEFLSAIALDP